MKVFKKDDLLKAIPIDIENLYEKADEPLPHSTKKWWWCWGGVIGLLFLVQAVTGLLLAVYYRAEPGSAYESVDYITRHARYGLFIRSVHQWGAMFMLIALFLHMVRVFVTGAFRNFRWGAWMAGVLLLFVTMTFCFTGYALLFDQVAYWGITITSNILSLTPLVGDLMKNFFLAGESINDATLSRLYSLHVQILPAALIGLVLVHIFFVRLLGMYIPGNEADRMKEKTTVEKQGPYHFFPDHVVSESAVFLYLLLVIFLLALAYPAVLGPPADPLSTPEHIKPEWYFLPFYHLLKLVSGTTGVLLMGFMGAAIFFWPLIDEYLLQRLDKLFKGKLESGLVLGVAVLGIYLAWALLEV